MKTEERTGECVYVIGTPGSNVVKIGRTTDLRQRLAAIQRMSPVPLEVLWTHPGGPELETRLHRYFADQRSHGEWFRFESDPVATIEAAMGALPHSPGRQPLDAAAKARWAKVLDKAAAEHAANRSALEGLIADCRRVGVPLTAISEHTPFSREWVRRIADRVDESIRAHLATHAAGEWCEECEAWPHMPLPGADGWCARCDVRADDHGDDIFAFPTARMREGVETIPVAEYRGTGSSWQYGAGGE